MRRTAAAATAVSLVDPEMMSMDMPQLPPSGSSGEPHGSTRFVASFCWS